MADRADSLIGGQRGLMSQLKILGRGDGLLSRLLSNFL